MKEIQESAGTKDIDIEHESRGASNIDRVEWVRGDEEGIQEDRISRSNNQTDTVHTNARAFT